MDIVKRIAWGNVDAVKEVWDFCSAAVLKEIRSKFGKPRRPEFYDWAVEDKDCFKPSGACDPSPIWGWFK